MRPSRFRGDRILPEGKCASGPRGRTAPPRRGAPLVGVLPRSGVGEPRDYKRCVSADELRAGAKASADRVLKRARRDEHSDALLATARSDAARGRLPMPRDAAAEPPPDGAVVIPRFGVPQGVKEDGSPKARRTWRWRPSRRPSRGRYVRWTTAAPPTSTERRSPRPPETRRRGCRLARLRAQGKLRHDTVDSLYDVAQVVHEASRGDDVLLFKADIDAAFRRVPLCPRDRDFAWVAFRHGHTVLVAQHTALPFGAGERAARAPSRPPPPSCIVSEQRAQLGTSRRVVHPYMPQAAAGRVIAIRGRLVQRRTDVAGAARALARDSGRAASACPRTGKARAGMRGPRGPRPARRRGGCGP